MHSMEHCIEECNAVYVQDPNTGVAMFETPKINEYLESTYAL